MTASWIHRARALAFAAGLAAIAGCGDVGRGPTFSAAVQPTAAPRAIELPERISALAERRDDATVHASRAAAAGYEQAGGSTPQARIRGVGVASSSSTAAIREPLSAPASLLADRAPLAAPPAAVPPTQFVPLSLPPEAPASPPAASPPEFAPRPMFADAAPPQPRAEESLRSESAYRPLPPAQPQPALPTALAADPATEHAALAPVTQRAMEMSNHAYSLAHRGMLYASRAELIQSLQLVAQALDVQRGTTTHAAALTSALTALKEAQDFAPAAGRSATPDVAEITRAHQTPVLKEVDNLSPVLAQQQYLAYAQSQLTLASGRLPVASLTLFRLGKLQMAMAQNEADPQMQHGPRAMVFYQAALQADDRNFLAANELGVLMARYGQLQEARRLLVHSVQVQPHVEAWHNLSVVHQRLGETDLATRAAHERELLAAQTPAKTTLAGNVEWVDAQTFATRSGSEVPWSENVARRPAAGPGSETR